MTERSKSIFRLSSDGDPIQEALDSVLLPFPDLGFDYLKASENDGSAIAGIIADINLAVKSNRHFRRVVKDAHGLSSSHAMFSSVLNLEFEPVIQDLIQKALGKEWQQEKELSGFWGEQIIDLSSKGSFTLSDDWKNQIEGPCYTLFDERSGSVIVINDADIPDSAINALFVSAPNPAYDERHPNNYMQALKSYFGGRHYALDPHLFRDTVLAKKEDIFGVNSQIRLTGYDSYFVIERKDGAWKVPEDRINKVRDVAVQVFLKVVDLTSPLLNPEQSPRDPRPGGA